MSASEISKKQAKLENLEGKIAQMEAQAEELKRSLPNGHGIWHGFERVAGLFWHAGLGAAIKLEKGGRQLLESLVEEGVEAERVAKDGVEKQVAQVRESATEAKQRAAGQLHRLEERFDHRLHNALHHIGVPTREDVDELTQLVGEVSESVGHLAQEVKALAPQKGKAGKPPGQPAA